MFAAGWLLLAEFIFTLALALEFGGLLIAEACLTGMCDMEAVTREIDVSLEVLLLLMFMAAGIHFVRNFLLFIFTRLMLRLRSSTATAFMFCFPGALISAFVDALTVPAIIISICAGLYSLRVSTLSSSAKSMLFISSDNLLPQESLTDLEQFRACLRSILMQAAAGTATGGVCTIVGERRT